MSLSVSADIPAGTDLLGKSVTDLQSGIQIGTDEITGTLNYVTGYTGFSGDASEQSGNYLALHCTAADGVTITAQVIGGDHGEATLDEDGLIIFRIKNNTQKVRITAKKAGIPDYSKEYSLANLTLAGG